MSFWGLQSYNHFHNILRLFGILPNFLFTASETMRDYYLKRWYMGAALQVTKRLKTFDLRKLEHIKKVSKLLRMRALCPVFLPLTFSHSALFHMKTGASLKYFVKDCRIMCFERSALFSPSYQEKQVLIRLNQE